MPERSTWESVGKYAEATRASSYSLALVLPFLAVYELGLVALRLSHESFHQRNGADAIIRGVLFPIRMQSAGAWGALAWSTVSGVVLAACWLVWRTRERAVERRRGTEPPPFEGRYAGWLFGESAGWAGVLFLASVVFFRGVYGTESMRAAADASPAARVAAEVVFNAGAGVYEELVFRVFLVLLFALFFKKIVHLEGTQGGVAAAVAAAVVFSLVHFGGADPWGGQGFWALFLFRAAAGLFFSLLFYFRSFGVAVAAHALYDNLVTAANAF